MWPFSLRNFQDFLIHLFRNPVLRPGFPLFFQHGQPEGLRRGRLCPPLAWDDFWPSYLRLLKVIQPLLPPKLLWWPPRHPRLRWWRQGWFPRSGPRLRPPHPCIRTTQWLLMTSLLLLLRRSPTRCFWQESHGSYHLFPSVQRSLVLRSLLVRRWRRRRLDPDFPRPSQGTRTPPGLSSLRPLASGFACQPAKRSRWDRREISDDSSSSDGRQRSTRPRRPWQSRPPGPHRRNSSHSPSPHRRYRSSPAPCRWSSGAGMTKRLAGRPSPSPQRRSSSHHRRSRRPSRGRQSSPASRSRGPHHRRSSSSSRSPSPKRHRTDSISPRRHGSQSASLERDSHPYDSDIRLLRLRADDDDQHPASTHPRNSPDPGQTTSVDASLLSAEKVQKLFAYLNTPSALSHYADPIPDSASNKQLVPYVRTSTSTASTLGNSEPLETHGLFQNYQSFHRLSGDTEKEACMAAYHDLTNLMSSQTEESPLINVSSSRPKTDEPFPCGLTSSNEMKKKHDKLHL